MNDWQSTYLGRGALPRDLSGFEIESVLYVFRVGNAAASLMTSQSIARPQARPMALQIGFLRMTGHLLEALRMVPPAVWRHLGAQFYGSTRRTWPLLRTMYRRRRTFI